MLFDVFFFGLPIFIVICFGSLAIREADNRFWRPAFCFFAYCCFYLAGGREVMLYLSVALMMGGGASSYFGGIEAPPAL